MKIIWEGIFCKGKIWNSFSPAQRPLCSTLTYGRIIKVISEEELTESGCKLCALQCSLLHLRLGPWYLLSVCSQVASGAREQQGCAAWIDLRTAAFFRLFCFLWGHFNLVLCYVLNVPNWWESRSLKLVCGIASIEEMSGAGLSGRTGL